MAQLILEPQRFGEEAGRLDAQRLFRASAPVAIGIGLGAYAGGYPARLLEALADTYEAVARWVGEPAFADLVLRYSAAYPPASYNLNDFGGSLARFLRRDPLRARFPFVADLAALEWRIVQAFHAGPGEYTGTPDLAGATVDDLARVTLALHPGVALLRSRWPVSTLWKIRPEAEPLAPDMPLPERATENVVVHRVGFAVRLRRVDDDEFRALRSAARGATLAAVLESAFDRGVAPERIATWPAQWRNLGIVTGWRRLPASPDAPRHEVSVAEARVRGAGSPSALVSPEAPLYD